MSPAGASTLLEAVSRPVGALAPTSSFVGVDRSAKCAAGRDSRKATFCLRPGGYRSALADDEWVDAEAAARYINLPISSIHRLLHEGRLEVVCPPVRVRRQDVEDCAERCQIRPGELTHLNAYPGGASRVAEPPLTKKGRPDRRYGRRY